MGYGKACEAFLELTVDDLASENGVKLLVQKAGCTLFKGKRSVGLLCL